MNGTQFKGEVPSKCQNCEWYRVHRIKNPLKNIFSSMCKELVYHWCFHPYWSDFKTFDYDAPCLEVRSAEFKKYRNKHRLSMHDRNIMRRIKLDQEWRKEGKGKFPNRWEYYGETPDSWSKRCPYSKSTLSAPYQK